MLAVRNLMTSPPSSSPPSPPAHSQPAAGPATAGTPSPEELDRIVAIWTRVVQTQEHFNDICMRVRTLYSTFIGAIIAVYGFLIDKSKEDLSVGTAEIDALIPIAIAGWLVSVLFYFVDRYWYHALLLGAVDQGAEIEAKWALFLPELRLGSKISARSPVDLVSKPYKYRIARCFVSDPRLKQTKKLHSDAKIEMFYKPVGRLMLAVAAASLLFGGVSINGRSVVGAAWAGITDETPGPGGLVSDGLTARQAGPREAVSAPNKAPAKQSR